MSDVIERATRSYLDAMCLTGHRNDWVKAAIRVVLEDMAADNESDAFFPGYLKQYAAKLGIDLTKPEEADNGR